MTSMVSATRRATLVLHDLASRDDWLGADAKFPSPTVGAPRIGRAVAVKYWRAAADGLDNGGFHSDAEGFKGSRAIAEFDVTIEGAAIDGIDILRRHDADDILAFKVEAPPREANDLVPQRMAQALELGRL